MNLLRAFEKFHRDNPHVYPMFKQFAFAAIERGHKRLSARMIFHGIRWETYIATNDPHGFKINNNHSPFYARMFMQDHPAYDGFFELRTAVADHATVATGEEPMKPAELIAAYMKLRTKIKDIETRHKEELLPYQNLKVEIETALLAHLNEAGTDSTKCKDGTAYKSTATSVVVRDWPATLDFIQTNELWDLLEARVNKTVAMELIEEKHEPIPGVEMSQATVLRVRST